MAKLSKEERRKQAAAELLAMQAALGKALSSWGSIEGTLSLIFTRGVTARSSGSASAVFATILSFEVKIAVTNAGIKMTYKRRPDVLAEWDALFKRVDKLRPKRNKLAHGQIVRQEKGNEIKVRFAPFYYPLHHNSIDAFEQWTLEEVEALSRQFRDLSSELYDFGMEITFGEKHSPESPEPTPERRRSRS